MATGTPRGPAVAATPRRAGGALARASSLRGHVYRVPASVPYWGASTIAAIGQALVTGRVVSGPHTGLLAERLTRLLDGAGVVACGSGRVAIELALRALGIEHADEVVVPSFCCSSIIPPILAVGATPVLADVGADLNLTVTTVDAALTPRTRAVIVPHLFGNPADIIGIEALCRTRGIAVIDDAAQALGATLDGRPVGTFGAAGIVSFGRGKICFGTGGGALVTRDPEIGARAARVALALPAAVPGTRNALSVLVWRRWRRVTLPGLVAVSKLRRAGRERHPYRREAMRNVDASVALTLLDTLHENIQARRARAARYQDLLGRCAEITLVTHGPGSACLTQLVRVGAGHGGDGSKATAVLEALRAAGVEADRSYRPLHLAPQYAPFARRQPRVAETTWPHLIELPCEPSVSLDTVDAIAAVVRRAVA